MPIDIEKARIITNDSNGIIKTSERSFSLSSAFYKAFGPQIKLSIENTRGTVVDKYLLPPAKARKLADALHKLADETEKKFKNLPN